MISDLEKYVEKQRFCFKNGVSIKDLVDFCQAHHVKETDNIKLSMFDYETATFQPIKSIAFLMEKTDDKCLLKLNSIKLGV